MFDAYSSDECGLDPERLGDERLYFERLMPREWKFLFRWFEVVAGRFSVAEPLRLDSSASCLGRDLAHDYWIARYRTVRESVVLLTLLAHANYDAWLAELRRATRFTGVKWSNIRQHHVPRKYCFSFHDGGENTDAYSWERLQNVFGHANWSEQFLADFAQACAVAKAHGLDDIATAVQFIPIKFCIQPHEIMKKAQQIALLKNLTKTVAAILAMEDEARRQGAGAAAPAPDGTPPRPPVFRLECVELDLRKFEFHSTVLKEIQRLIETGVHIQSLTLPSHGARHSRETDETQRLNWGLFLCAISGQPQPPRKQAKVRGIHIERLVFPPVFPSKMWSLPLCAALATAKGLKAVKIEHGYIQRGIETDQSRLWAWMGYAFFRASATTSVETLELTGFKLTNAGLEALSETMRPRDGLDALVGLCSNTSRARASRPTGGRTVVVQKGSIAEALDVDEDRLKRVVMPCDWEGVVVAEEGTELHVLLPGLGLWRVDRESVPNKRQKTSAPRATLSPNPSGSAVDSVRRGAAIKTLVLGLRPKKEDPDRIDAKPFVARLLELVGRPLSTLHLHADGVDDKCLDACLRQCPNLRGLHLYGLSLATLDPLIRAYQQQSAKIASLELRDIKELLTDEFEYFLSHLEPTAGRNAIKTHLRKLRIGRGWSECFRRETVQQMQRILEDPNSKLSHVHAFSCSSSSSSKRPQNRSRLPAGWCIRQYRGTCVEDSPLDAVQRLAFLSVLRRTNRLPDDANPHSLRRSTIVSIFKFAAAATSRVVLEDFDTDMPDFIGERVSEYESY